MTDQKFTVTLTPKKVVYFLSAIAVFLIIAHVIGIFMKFTLGHNSVYGFVPFSNLNAEKNASTLFSTCLFLISSILFLIVWKVRLKIDKHQWIWLFLSGLFCFLAIDEFSEIHERLVEPVRSALHTSGFLSFAWVIPYGIAGILLSIFLFPFFLQIDKKIRYWFGLSALIYFVGALGFEMIGAWYVSTRDFDIVCGFLIMVEESLEMTGLIMLIYSLLSLLQSKYPEFVIILPSASESSKY